MVILFVIILAPFASNLFYFYLYGFGSTTLDKPYESRYKSDTNTSTAEGQIYFMSYVQ